MATYAAYNGDREYNIVRDGVKYHGQNEDDGSVVGVLTHVKDGQKVADYLVVNRLDPAAVQRAFDAVGKTSNVLDLVAVYPQIKAWFSKYVQENPVPKPEPAITPATCYMIPLVAEPLGAPWGSIATADGVKWNPDGKGWGIFWKDIAQWHRLFP